MKKITFPNILIALLPFWMVQCTQNTVQPTPFMDFKKIPVTYPFSQKDTSVSDTYFGTKVSDPYRWLEDDQSAATKDWVMKQNIVTNGYLGQIPIAIKYSNA